MTMEITFKGTAKVTASFNGHIIKTDQPVQAGGDSSAPTPFELFLASIGTCAGIYIKSFCNQRNIRTDRIKIIQSIDYDSETGLPSDISLNIQLPTDFPERYKEAVVKAADLCKVKRTIMNPPRFEITTSVGQ